MQACTCAHTYRNTHIHHTHNDDDDHDVRNVKCIVLSCVCTKLLDLHPASLCALYLSTLCALYPSTLCALYLSTLCAKKENPAFDLDVMAPTLNFHCFSYMYIFSTHFLFSFFILCVKGDLCGVFIMEVRALIFPAALIPRGAGPANCTLGITGHSLLLQLLSLNCKLGFPF